MAEKKTTKTASAKSSTKAASKSKATAAPKSKATKTVSAAPIAAANGAVLTLGAVKPAKGSRPKRTRVGRGHGSGMVKTGGEGGKGQTVRSGGGKGPAFEGGQTPWQRRLPHRRGYSQKARDIGHFRTRYAVVNLHDLADWDASVEVTPQTLKVAKKIKDAQDGVKILGGSKTGKTLPSGLRFRDVLFSTSAREALAAAGASVEEA
ncbi:MAG TPA: 50S ribosomal protein L15 [Candidatus Baltobacteraceae bacterium]|nr:50S ribosomal protein L15 [Candidatus Baltobacteraceae bacterium]